ncbi:MAG TPA: adenosine deaminase [Burkholderiaceae bacterium]|nr:adenosine deaminase [Burkholderiaceae bacterium]
MTSPPAASPNFHTLPKALLHEHIDGGLRPTTLLELAHARGLALPTDDPAALADWMHANANSGSLERYLRGFALTVGAMATPEACERVAFEAAEDARRDGCVLAEFRMAPLLLEPFGLRGEAVVEALAAGLARSALPCGLIVCAMRTDAPEETLRAADLAARYAGKSAGRGVIGFDLAGAERGFPPGAHAAAFARARGAGLGVTCHAGESDAGSRVLEAAALGATRIGHGVHIMSGRSADETARWVDQARALGLHFEVCPSSNIHTGAFASLAEHPIRKMVEAGLSVSCSTDNRLMSGVTLSDELAAVHAAPGLSTAQLAQTMRSAAAASFLPADVRAAALHAMQAWPD